MSAHRNDYFATQVMTASQPKLHLMLIDGAIRSCRTADQALMRDEERPAADSLQKAMDIVAELLAGVRHAETDLNAKLAQLYQYVFTSLARVYVNGDRGQLADAERILGFQRDTWKMACDKLAEDSMERSDAASSAATPHTSSGEFPQLDASAAAPGGLSLQA